MKIKHFIPIVFFLFTINLHAQKGDQLKSLKIGYITQTLNLTPNEAQSFWPIYNKHQDKIHYLRKNEQRKLIIKVKNSGGIESISEDNAEKLINKFIEIENQIQAEQTSMYIELKGVISAKKILKLYQAETEFNRKILQRLRKEKEKNRP